MLAEIGYKDGLIPRRCNQWAEPVTRRFETCGGKVQSWNDVLNRPKECYGLSQLAILLVQGVNYRRVR